MSTSEAAGVGQQETRVLSGPELTNLLQESGEHAFCQLVSGLRLGSRGLEAQVPVSLLVRKASEVA